MQEMYTLYNLSKKITIRLNDGTDIKTDSLIGVLRGHNNDGELEVRVTGYHNADGLRTLLNGSVYLFISEKIIAATQPL